MSQFGLRYQNEHTPRSHRVLAQSSYARQFLGQMEKPKVDYIGGLSPAIAIEQKAVSKNPRSTVAMVAVGENAVETPQIVQHIRRVGVQADLPSPGCATFIAH